MAWYLYILIFIFSSFILSWLSSMLIASLINVAKYLRWKEFVIAFFVMAFAASLPNLFVDLSAVFHGMPELALGDIIGGNLIDLTLVLAVAVFFSRNGFSVRSEMVQKSAIFTSIIAVLPLVLIFDKRLDRIDGVILISAFIFYSWWLFSKKERFKKTYAGTDKKFVRGFKSFLINVAKIAVLLVLLLIASQAVVGSAQFFSNTLGISLSLVGILIIGLGNCFPEMYFSIISARKEENWLVLGDLMGSVIITSTLVLGIIALTSPFVVRDISPFFIARIFLVAGSVCALIFIRSGKKVTKKEGLMLLAIYVIFLITEIFII